MDVVDTAINHGCEMSVVSEVADAIKLLSELIKNTQSIVKAINDGREYLYRNHPDASDDFAKLLSQMQITIEGLATVTGVLQGFRFTVGSRNVSEASLERFNEHVVRHHEKVAELRGKLRQLKNDCEKIKKLRDKIAFRSKSNDWGTIFSFLGIDREKRRHELAGTLSNFYADDQRMIDAVESTLRLAEQALDDVDQSLGPSGRADSYNIHVSARILGIYADMFKAPNKKLHSLVDEMSRVSNTLERN